MSSSGVESDQVRKLVAQTRAMIARATEAVEKTQRLTAASQARRNEDALRRSLRRKQIEQYQDRSS